LEALGRPELDAHAETVVGAAEASEEAIRGHETDEGIERSKMDDP
jgi:hypothetical protein